ncbi:hypothetical protein [endosymbiont DhMRE of Dentiscutata heterogama]|uniref:hypothetical protein n=1 Tax=endosymbiont DhMRE of Dentiscutata heterogama TaxID=1609546 RepID=UPI002AD1EC2D|nr:hypothetical protein [endosymbiont DhMRE of Dentiscutata heterogama]
MLRCAKCNKQLKVGEKFFEIGKDSQWNVWVWWKWNRLGAKEYFALPVLKKSEKEGKNSEEIFFDFML